MTVTSEQFAAAMAEFDLGPRPRLAVAVSGGGDSVALCLLLQRYGAEITALTVDHGLRPGSRREAEKLGVLLSSKGIPHDILTWEGEKPATHVQERAREARYGLLLEACRKKKISALALGHNLEDQVETFWMRLAHGSGLDGLSGMAAERMEGGVRMIRPLLSFRREALRRFCDEMKAPYVDDPSNENQKFLRVRLRQFEETLAAEGFTPERLSRTVEKLKSARAALDWMTEKALAECVMPTDRGLALKKDLWLRYPEEIRCRVVMRVLQQVRPQDYPAGSEALSRLCANIAQAGFSGQTLGGCILSPLKSGDILIQPETPSESRRLMK